MAALLRKEEREWFKSNDLRRRLHHNWFDREILKGGEHPIRYGFCIAVLLACVVVLGTALPEGWFSEYRSLHEPAEELSYFTSLWSIQATLAALVYPFVIAFVALLLQRRPTSKAFLQIYLSDSGGLVAGMSSLFLVLCMAMHYVMLPTTSLHRSVTWVAGYSIWFVYNIVLTLRFLFRTVEFLRSDFQMEVVTRYTVNVAMPREIANLLRFQFFANAQKKGWIPGPAYLDEDAEGQPQVLMHSVGRGMGEVAVKRYLRKESRLANVFYWPLRLAVAGWLRKARKQQPVQSSNPLVKTQSNLLVFHLTPGNTYEAAVVLARVEGGPELTLWQRALVQMSFSFTPLRHERHYVTSGEVLADLETDARISAENGDVAAFEEAYRRITEMHNALLGASLGKGDDGSVGSFALLPDVSTFFDRPVHEKWANKYESLFDAATSLLPKETRPICRLCHVVQHLNEPGLQESSVEIRERILLLPTQLMDSLRNWWSQKIEEQGILQHGSNQMVLLRPPLQGAYEEALLHFVSGWDAARRVLAEFPDRGDKFIWLNAKNLLRLNAEHINQTCLLLLRAVATGDQAAAEWLTDVISKWRPQARAYDQEPFGVRQKSKFITTEVVNQDWEIVEHRLGLNVSDKSFIGGDVSATQRHVCLAALRNYWRDVRLLTLEILLSWAAKNESHLGEHSLAFHIARGFLTGRNWRSGGETVEPLSQLTASDYLTAKARQYGSDSTYREGYVGRLDHFVESAKNILRPNMVPGRVYSYSGASNVQSLQEAQLIILAILSIGDWRLGESLRAQLALWASSSFQSTALVQSRAVQMRQRLDEIQDGLSPELIDRLLLEIGKSHTRVEGIARTRNAINMLLDEISGLQSEVVANAQVSRQRLEEIETASSEQGFSKTTGDFPIQLFSSITYEEAPQEPFSLTIPKLRKGELTDVEMAQRAANERESYAEALADTVGNILLADVFHQSEVRDICAPDATTYWSALKEEANSLKERGLTPVLILDNPTRPDWVWEWEYPDQKGLYPRPSDLVVRHEEGRGANYVADFNDIQVFSGAVAHGQSLLLARETFSKVTFRKYRDQVFVRADTAEVSGSRTLVDLQLTFERHVQVGHSCIVRILYQVEPTSEISG
jgi:hypothetical protein